MKTIQSMIEHLPCVVVVMLLLAFVATSGGCQGQSTVGNGKVDPVEAATLRVAVGMALSSRPAAVEPAYKVSTALLTIMDDKTVLADELQAALGRETAKLNMDMATAVSFVEFVSLVEAQVRARLAEANISASTRMVVIREVLIIVRDAAAARLPTGGPEPAA
ncbi:MAG: hypothetical protein LBD10_14695 [Desulfobulbus sp.]|uniref:hypothetical protein n=1 Tax=Desulfobulbus sp. TaxID=895 RepID=UPI00284275F4|nr:hypothetical protein [Desulfobulbus sp.]MDR2551436.1 hypothetical protein [Desulfobulbus sp.]